MQQTSIDRWLQKKFVYISRVYTNSLPSYVPAGVELEDAGDGSMGLYRYCFTVQNDKQMSELTANLEVANITYTSRVSERGGWAGKLFNDPTKSFTLRIAWIAFTIFILSIIFSGLPVRLWNQLSVADDSIPPPRHAVTHSSSASHPK